MPYQMFPSVTRGGWDGNAYAAWVRTKNDVFRIEGIKRLVAEVAPDKCAIGTQATEGSLKPAQWHLGIDFAVQSQNLQCFCHAVGAVCPDSIRVQKQAQPGRQASAGV